MTDTCTKCGADAAWVGTLVDDSGGALVSFCEGCRRLLRAPRCDLCGSPEGNGKADGLAIEDEWQARIDLCDTCRERLLYRGRRHGGKA